MRLILIRHSKTARDPSIPICQWGLSDEGIELARLLASHPTIQTIEALYTSFQTKALETALLLAKPHAIPIRPDDGLTEVTSFTGAFDPDFDHYTKNVHAYYFDQIDRIQGGETKIEALTRFTTTLESIVKNAQGKETIGIVTHGHILSLFCNQYAEVDSYALHSTIAQPDIAIFDWEQKKFCSFFGELFSPSPLCPR